MFNHENFILKLLILSMLLYSTMMFPYFSYASELRAEPNKITFNNLNQQYTIKIFKDGTPIRKSEIKGWSFLVDEHAYNHMVKVSIQDGYLSVKPAELETGTYELVINTAYGKVTIPVYAPLDQLFGSIEDRARMTGKTVEEVKREIGLYTPSPRTTISINLPAQYYEGQTVKLNIDGDVNNYYIWKVNERVVSQGLGKTVFEYTFPEPGEYTIAIEEKSGDITLGSATAKTKVISYEPIKVNAIMNQPITLKGAPNYTKYQWLVDGVDQNKNTEEATFRFNAEKEFKVECIASQPKEENLNSFVRTIYLITVSKK